MDGRVFSFLIRAWIADTNSDTYDFILLAPPPLTGAVAVVVAVRVMQATPGIFRVWEDFSRIHHSYACIKQF